MTDYLKETDSAAQSQQSISARHVMTFRYRCASSALRPLTTLPPPFILLSLPWTIILHVHRSFVAVRMWCTSYQHLEGSEDAANRRKMDEQVSTDRYAPGFFWQRCCGGAKHHRETPLPFKARAARQEKEEEREEKRRLCTNRRLLARSIWSSRVHERAEEVRDLDGRSSARVSGDLAPELKEDLVKATNRKQ